MTTMTRPAGAPHRLDEWHDQHVHAVGAPGYTRCGLSLTDYPWTVIGSTSCCPACARSENA